MHVNHAAKSARGGFRLHPLPGADVLYEVPTRAPAIDGLHLRDVEDAVRVRVPAERDLEVVRRGSVELKVQLYVPGVRPAQMEGNAQLDAYVQSNDFDWLFESDWFRNSCSAILESDAMEEYIQTEKFDFEADKELVRKLYKEFIENSEDLDTLLEEQNIYWNGDKELIDSFVLKTIKAFEDGKVGEQPLKTEFKDDEDRQFAIDLLHHGLEMAQEREQVVAANCRRWDPSRLAFLDVIIIQVAMAEMLCFPQIPLKVTINEYVELAKLLSTPASGSFVNGMLDTIVKDMTSQGRIEKEF